MEETLFSDVKSSHSPLAERMRPTQLGQVVGQTHFLNPRFKQILESDKWVGLIFWGPPGTGKTTLATVIANMTKRPFQALSAVTAGVKEIREAMDHSRKDLEVGRPAHILFIDEVHRLNKGQQDVLLPHLESGVIRFIGATTENPSFEINNAVASRCVIFHFSSLSEADLQTVLRQSAQTMKANIEEEVLKKIAQASVGDARRALTLLEHLLLGTKADAPITEKDFDELVHSQSLYYDKKSESHYDTISAFIKSVRGGDPDAALYYLARMLEGGEDPLFIARRLIILASEDIGNASPMGLVIATSAFSAVHAIGMPEARIILSQATTYLSCCEKSNRSYVGINEAIETVKKTGALEIPMSLRNPVTNAMKDWGYGKNYLYPHQHEKAWVKSHYLPEAIKQSRFYRPSDRGTEKRFQEFLKEHGKE